LKVSNLKVFGKALSIQEASQFVRTLKTPSEMVQRVAKLKANINLTKENKYNMLSKLITELLAIFPNAMPQKILFSKASELGLEEEFVSKILKLLHEKGLMIRNKDKTNFNSNFLLKFPSIPFKEGKIIVDKPIPNAHFRKKKWN